MLRRHALLTLSTLALASLRALAGSFEDFFHAIDQDNDVAMQTLIQRGFDVNTLNDKLVHPLLLCIEADANKVLAVLLKSGQTRINHANPHGETALMMAALRDKPQMVRMLLLAKAQVNQPGWTALHYASTAGSTEITRMLLDAHAYIDAESPNGSTPLMMAARYGNDLVVKLLLEEGADPTLKNQQDLSAVDFALLAGREDHAILIRNAMVRWGRK